MSTTTNVTAGKPKIGGAIYRAALGTALPTSATSELNSIWEEVGYCSDSGLTNSNTRSSEQIKAWGGDVVLTTQTEKTDTFQMTWIELLNTVTLKAVHGDDNVTGTLSDGITIKVNAHELDAASYVIDMLLRDGAVKRIVIPNGKISEVGDVVYSDNEVAGYEVTLTCLPDSDGNTHYEYIVRKASVNVTVPTMLAEAADTVIFGHTVGDMQDNITITSNAITGTLKKLTSGALVDRWGEGYFVALKFEDFDENATSVKVGLDPSESSGLVEIIDDPDKNGAFKITNKATQVFKIVATDGTYTTTKAYDLSGLTLEA